LYPPGIILNEQQNISAHWIATQHKPILFHDHFNANNKASSGSAKRQRRTAVPGT
jgi:hypothetical protein